MPTRRNFLKQSAVVSLAPLVPAFLSQSLAAKDVTPNDRVLVVIQLDGGNDGLNTVIPFADEAYARHRRELRIASDKVLKLDDAVALHPQMRGMAKLYEERRLAIVQGVGYPNPNRSHFESMAIWHHARLDAADHDRIGWLGRAADSLMTDKAATDAIYVGGETLPVALRGRRANVVTLENESDLTLSAEISDRRRELAGVDNGSRQLPDSTLDHSSPTAGTEDISSFVQRTIGQSFDAAQRFRESDDARQGSPVGYPETRLGRKLRLVSKLLQWGGGTRIFYVAQPGYDTHTAQAYPHSELLREFSGALWAFLDDLTSARLDERVVVMAFSEFGRRVEENGSAGTDHGVAGPMFLAGTPVAGGLIGAHPRLDDLDDGDLRMSIDFRRVYAALLKQWLGVSDTPLLGQSFAPLDFLKPAR